MRSLTKSLTTFSLAVLITSTCWAANPENSTNSSIGQRDADDSVRVIGNLPYSNQWTFEKPSNVLYINYDRLTLGSPFINVSHFEDQYSTSLNLVSLDFFSRLFSLADPSSSSWLRKFSFWGRYKLGFGLIQGSLADVTTASELPAEKSSLLVLAGQIGINFSYDWLEWIQPYVGFNYKPYYFRNTSSMSSAESEGQSVLYGPSVGLHLPIFFSHKGSLFAELYQNIAPSGGNQLFTNQLGSDFGMGLVF